MTAWDSAYSLFTRSWKKIASLRAEVKRLTEGQNLMDDAHDLTADRMMKAEQERDEAQLLAERRAEQILEEQRATQEALAQVAWIMRDHACIEEEDGHELQTHGARALLDRLHALEVSVNLLQEANIRWWRVML